MLTRQEMFDKVVEGLASQDFQQSTDIILIGSELKESCAYRGKNGLKCAAGHLIPDELYNSKMENMTITNIIRQYTQLYDYLVCSDEIYKYNKFVSNLQFAHDEGGCAVIMIDNLKQVAVSANLNTQKLDEAEKILEAKLKQQKEL